jgi:uncharacterized iron-regulated membrane protein
MSFLQRWLRQPQSVWARKALFQIHLWTGIGASIYIMIICVTGSALVFRPELTRAFARGPVLVASSGTLLTDQAIREAAQRQHPGFVVSNLFRAKQRNAAAEVWLESSDRTLHRLFNPFTGTDMGESVPFGMRAVSWLLDLHDNLFGGENGRLVNGTGGVLLTILSLTGIVIWWPGIKNWRRSLMLRRGVGWKRFNWDLHSAVGFWTVAIVFMFAVSGAYLVFQEWIMPVIDYIQPLDDSKPMPRTIDDILLWLPRLHFGRFRGIRPSFILSLKITWVIIGLAPAILSVTGMLMWWNRVVRKAVLQSAPEPKIVQGVSLETASLD